MRLPSRDLLAVDAEHQRLAGPVIFLPVGGAHGSAQSRMVMSWKTVKARRTSSSVNLRFSRLELWP
ncbi:MAG: hypothetical protein NTX42_11490 [Methanothrix sp.]|nr:hypothetical protein [Methanothrix sp.]